MKTQPFTRRTIVAAIEYLGATLTQARFDQLLVRLGLDHEIALGSGKSVTAKSAVLAGVVARRGTQPIDTLDGSMTLGEAAVRIAVDETVPEYGKPEQERLLRGLALDGYVVTWDSSSRTPLLRAALPNEVDLPKADDEVHQLLKHFRFHIPLGP